MNNWFLIPKATVDLVRKTLVECIEDFDLKRYKDVLHEFDTNLHITNEVPDDFKEINNPIQEVYDEWGVPVGRT